MIEADPSPDDFGDANSIMSGPLHCRRATNEIWTALYGMHKLCIPESERYVPHHQRADFAEFMASRPAPTTQFEAIARIAYGSDPEEIAVSMEATWEDAADAGCMEYVVVMRDLGPSGFKGEVTATPCTAAEEQIRIGIARLAEPWEVLAATLTPEPEQTWARRLEVASILHGPDDTTAVPATGDRGATWPN